MQLRSPELRGHLRPVPQPGDCATALPALLQLWSRSATGGVQKKLNITVHELPNSATSHWLRLRPLENYRCWDCKSLFIDATVEARCLSCGRHHAPEELAVGEIRPIRLLDKGRISLVNQANHTTQQSTIDLESSTVLSEIEFNNLLDWQISILRKDNQCNSQSAPPALVAIWKTEGELYPEDDTNLRQEDWINTLLERLDETDRVTCSGQRLLWILRPQCNNEELTNLIRQCKKHLSFLPSRGDQHYTIEGRLLNDQQSRLGDALTLKNRILACLANPAGDEHLPVDCRG